MATYGPKIRDMLGACSLQQLYTIKSQSHSKCSHFVDLSLMHLFVMYIYPPPVFQAPPPLVQETPPSLLDRTAFLVCKGICVQETPFLRDTSHSDPTFFSPRRPLDKGGGVSTPLLLTRPVIGAHFTPSPPIDNNFLSFAQIYS